MIIDIIVFIIVTPFFIGIFLLGLAFIKLSYELLVKKDM